MGTPQRQNRFLAGGDPEPTLGLAINKPVSRIFVIRVLLNKPVSATEKGEIESISLFSSERVPFEWGLHRGKTGFLPVATREPSFH